MFSGIGKWEIRVAEERAERPVAIIHHQRSHLNSNQISTHMDRKAVILLIKFYCNLMEVIEDMEF